jgi:hypothetical protein
MQSFVAGVSEDLFIRNLGKFFCQNHILQVEHFGSEHEIDLLEIDRLCKYILYLILVYFFFLCWRRDHELSKKWFVMG